MSRIPAWKRLGLKLSNAEELPDEANGSISAPEREASSKKRKLDGEVNGGHESNHTINTGGNSHASKLGKKRKLSEADCGFEDGNVRRTRTNEADITVDPSDRPRGSSKKSKMSKPHQGSESQTNESHSPPSSATLAASPVKVTSAPSVARRKSVAFTPETKIEDGSSAQQLFKAWVQEQKDAGHEAEFTAEQVAEFLPPPKKHIANADGVAAQSNEEPLKRSKKARKEQKKAVSAPEPDIRGSPQAGKGENEIPPNPSEEQPSVEERKAAKKALREARTISAPSNQSAPAYLEYLINYHTTRSTWKFNKAKQTDLLKNLFNIYRIPHTHDDALIAYISGLQGQAARDRLRESAKAVIAENIGDTPAPTASDQAESDPMDDPVTRKAAHDDALRERLRKEKKRRREEEEAAREEDEAYQQKLQRRQRAERVLRVLGGQDVPNRPEHQQPTVNGSDSNRVQSGDAGQKRKRIRKRRVEVMDDETGSSGSSSSSSSDDASESETPSPGGSDDDDGDENPSSSSEDTSSASSSSDSGSDSKTSDEDSSETDSSTSSGTDDSDTSGTASDSD